MGVNRGDRGRFYFQSTDTIDVVNTLSGGIAMCQCDQTTVYRATSENGGEEYLYLRCADCGDKIGRVPIDLEALKETVTDPNTLPSIEDGAYETSHTPRVSIHFDASDSPWMFE